MPAVVYDSRYNIGFWGTDRLHPFDSRKYGRAWSVLEKSCGLQLARCHRKVDRPVTDEELLLVHSAEHLARLRTSAAIAAAVEISFLRRVPAWLLRLLR